MPKYVGVVGGVKGLFRKSFGGLVVVAVLRQLLDLDAPKLPSPLPLVFF